MSNLPMKAGSSELMTNSGSEGVSSSPAYQLLAQLDGEGVYAARHLTGNLARWLPTETGEVRKPLG